MIISLLRSRQKCISLSLRGVWLEPRYRWGAGGITAATGIGAGAGGEAIAAAGAAAGITAATGAGAGAGVDENEG